MLSSLRHPAEIVEERNDGTACPRGTPAAGRTTPRQNLLSRTHVILAGLLVMLAAAAIVCLAWINDSDRIDTHDAWIEHTHDVLYADQRLLTAASGLEAALRGFLLTQRPEFLEQYHSGIAAVHDELATLRTMIQESALQQGLVAELEGLVTARSDAVRQQIDLTRAGDVGQALALARSDGASQLADRLRSVTAAIDREENQLLAQRRAAAVKAQTRIRHLLRFSSLMITFLLACAGAMIIAIWSGLRETRRMAQVAAERACDADAMRRILDASPIGMGRLSVTGRVLDANDAYLEALGATRADLESGELDWTAATAPEWRWRDEQTVAELARFGRSRPCEKEIIGPDGARVPVLAAAAVLDTDCGEAASFIVDLTAARQSRAELAESVGLSRKLLESSADSIEVLDLDGHILSMNAAACRKLQVEAADSIIGRLWIGLWPEAQAPDVLAAMTAARHGREGRFVASMLAGDGMEHWWDVLVTPIVEHHGQPNRLLAVSRDITGIKASEAALREGEARLRLALQGAAIGVWVLDLEHRVVTFDERVSEISHGILPFGSACFDGPEVGEWVSRIHPDDAPQRERMMAAVIDGVVETVSYAYRVRVLDGSWRCLATRVILLERDQRTGQGRRMVGSMIDETAMVEAKAILERRIDQRTRALADAGHELQAETRRREQAEVALVQTQKLEALGQLTGGVVHDFNNILAVISGAFDLIRARTASTDVKRLIDNGQQAALRAAHLVRRLLAFARREALRPTRIDTAALLQDIDSLLRQSTGSSVTLEVETGAEVWPVMADRHRLEIALLNLAVNARDAMPDGGTLTIRTANRGAGDAFPAGLADGEYVCIAVADTGMGMPIEVLAHAMEPFFTTKAAGKGTGLGLAMVHGFATDSNGAVEIRSSPGKGTTVEILLPRADAADAQLLDEVPVTPDVHGGATILLVDDDEHVRMVTANSLQDLGYDVIEAPNAEAAYALAHASSRTDLVIADVVMPGADGPALADRLRADFPLLPIVFVTAHAYGRDLAGEQVLAKPFSSAALGRFVAQGLGRLETGCRATCGAER